MKVLQIVLIAFDSDYVDCIFIQITLIVTESDYVDCILINITSRTRLETH